MALVKICKDQQSHWPSSWGTCMPAQNIVAAGKSCYYNKLNPHNFSAASKVVWTKLDWPNIEPIASSMAQFKYLKMSNQLFLFLGFPQIVTDYVFHCPSRSSARAGTATGSKVWMYMFDHVASDPRVWSGLTFCYEHACHGAELPFLFGSASVANFTLSLSEKLLSNRMLCYWGAFAHTGDPSSRAQQTTFCHQQRLPVWPRYADTSSWLVMNLTVRSHAQVGTRDHICDFWDHLGIYYWEVVDYCRTAQIRGFITQFTLTVAV